FIVGGPVGDFELLLCHGTVCVVGKIRDLILQLSKSSIYSTKPSPSQKCVGVDISLLVNVKILWSSMSYPISQPQCNQVKQEGESLANLREINVKDIAKNEREDDGYIGPEEKLVLRFEPAFEKAH
ncbi:hypothetical protein ABKU14_21615, partial [Enterobacter roggenkampii]